jgi:hypothetical protein
MSNGLVKKKQNTSTTNVQLWSYKGKKEQSEIQFFTQTKVQMSFTLCFFTLLEVC